MQYITLASPKDLSDLCPVGLRSPKWTSTLSWQPVLRQWE